MKTEKKIKNPKPEARFKIKKLNQFYFFCEHTFHKLKKKKKLNLCESNMNDFKFESLKPAEDRFKNLIDISEFKIISK